MAFILKKDNTFKTKVKVSTPVDDRHHEWEFTAEFRILSSDDVAEGDALDRALVSVAGVPAEDGITEQELMDLLKHRGDTRAALWQAYNKAVVKKNQGGSFLA